MIDEGHDENTLEFGERHFGEREEEEECGVESERQTMALSSSNKRIQEIPAIDRLSVLPDSVLVHILSFLYTKGAARTSELSKRWKFLWAELPSLEFFENLNRDIEKTRYFVSVVKRTLGIRKSNHLEELRVKIMYNECFASDVDSWIEFSVKNEVKKLSLYIVWTSYNGNYYTPPQVMYSSSSLKTLQLNKCIMTLERKIEWQSLTSLSLEEVELDQCLIDEIISSCPVLYYLDLEMCWGFNRLEVSSRCLNCFKFEESDYKPYTEISAPYIRALNITVFLEEITCQLKDISSVVRATINFCEFDYGWTVEILSNAKEFLENISHIKELTLKTQCFKVLSIMALNGWQLPQSRVQHLTLICVSEYKHAISGIIGLLKSSPNLETLVMDFEIPECFGTEEEIVDLDPTANDDLNGDLLHLKTIRIEITPDTNGEPLLTSARILLRMAPVLEEMRIVVTHVTDKSDFVNIAQTLLTYPRSSATAEIHLFSCE